MTALFLCLLILFGYVLFCIYKYPCERDMIK